MFLESDVIKVASALLEDAIYWDHGHTNARNPHDGYSCNHCQAKEYQKHEELEHDLDCVVLIAQDLITKT